MIKGIKKHMIEVIDLESVYYEKAFLVVKPEYSDFKDNVLKREAKSLVCGFGVPSCVQRKAGNISWIIKMAIAAGIGAGITAFAMM